MALSKVAEGKEAMVDLVVRRMRDHECERAASGDLALEAQLRTMYAFVKNSLPVS